jgi:uncharacterized sporulation protein YeaH/YhbH (DUF444 family)
MGPKLCQVCGQPQWTKVVDPKTGRFIPDGQWDDGGTKYKAVKHTCTGQAQGQPPQEQSEAQIPKQIVGSSNSILFEQIETMNSVLGQILDIVLEKSKATNINSAGLVASISFVRDELKAIYEEVRLSRAEIQEVKNHFKISAFQQASQLPRRQPPEEHEARLEDVEELAGTDDQTKLDNRSINYAERE